MHDAREIYGKRRRSEMKNLMICFFMMSAAASASAETIKWPNGERAAVSLSYDDALNSQLDHALPALNKHGVRASFYLLLASPVVSARLPQWRAVAEAGHELGNHTLFHPCSASAPGRSWVKPHEDLDKRTVVQMQQEITTANAYLHAIDGRSERTFTPPCIETKTGDGDYLPAVHDQFIAVKGYEQNLPKGFTNYLIPEGQSGEQLIQFVEQASRNGGVTNIIFHGIGGDHLQVSAEAHAELIAYLAKNRKIYWTDTYLNIMKHVNANLLPSRRQPACAEGEEACGGEAP